MIRRISTKLVLAVLTAVVLPFVAYAFYINYQMGDRLTRHVVRQALLGLAKDMAGQIDYFIDERHQDLEQWAEAPLTVAAVDEYERERRLLERRRIDLGQGATPDELLVWDAHTMAAWAHDEPVGSGVEFENRLRNRAQLTRELDRYVRLKNVYDLLLLVGPDGRLITASSRDSEQRLFEETFLRFLFEQDFTREAWFHDAMAGLVRPVDHHVSPYRLGEVGGADDPAWGYHIGFAAPARDELRPDQVRGVLYGVVNWYFVQEIVRNEVVIDAFRGLVKEEEEPSPYAWIWAADADTILAHKDRSLYGRSVSRDVGLPQLTEAVRSDPGKYGLYPEYRFRGEDKNAAYCRGLPPTQGGFGWVIGVGIDNDDIYATAAELRALLLGGTAAVLVMAVLWTLLIARRTTEPIRELQRYTRRVAEGDLDARVSIRSSDELGALADDFNRMTHELKQQRRRLVKAEKDAAWREMARQIAHDIKNPLTPITLSLDLLERVRRERAAGSEEILERTMGLIRRQVEHLRRIALDFYEFTGGRKPALVAVDVGKLLDDVLHLHDAWAVELGVEIHREGPGAQVLADPDKLHRVLVNLTSNALEAMPRGGQLLVETALENGTARVTFRDTGEGIAEEARAHLFEPYFTTKREGTGLGLAISKQVIEQMDGTITLEQAEDPSGTVACVRLPVCRPGDATE